MTTRELWTNIMHYGEFDRLPVIHWTVWPETAERWKQEGLPEGVDMREFLNAVPHWQGVGANVGLFPAFEEEVLEETDTYRIFRDGEGVVKQDWKHESCIPRHIDFTLKDASGWPEFKKRLQPDPGRLGENFEERLRAAENSGFPLAISTGSMMGWIRNWMGVENMSYLMYDAPDCYADMVNTIADLVCWSIDETIPRMEGKPDLGFGWEDICGKTGPLVSPTIFDKCVAQGYRKIREKLESYGVTLLGIDSDGMVEPLIPNWLEAGVNVQFPIEPGTWGATPEHIRKRFGKELRIVGGFDKLVLEKGRAEIDAEIARHVDLVKEGGYVMMPDHLITPGTPLDNYRYYLDRVRELRF
ncbi:MAG: hypothetical protein K9N51_08685 [Candidatus Pacebacteria bacterium]|nr:hypothetical protein [Candidatus Paceibacterota bacterium]